MDRPAEQVTPPQPRRVSQKCEVIEQWAPLVRCGKPTAYWYPAMGGGAMALCDQHAQKHLPHGAWPYEPPSRAASPITREE